MAPIACILVQRSKPGTIEAILNAPYKIQAYYYGLPFLSSFILWITDTLYLEKA